MRAKTLALLAFLMTGAAVADRAAADDSFIVLGEAELDGITAGAAGASVLGAAWAGGPDAFAGTNATTQTFELPFLQMASGRGGATAAGPGGLVSVQTNALASVLTLPSADGKGVIGTSITALAQIFVFVVVPPR